MQLFFVSENLFRFRIHVLNIKCDLMLMIFEETL